MPASKPGALETIFAAPPGEPVIIITRIFDAPRSLVFDAWTKPEHVMQWWGRRGGSALSVCEIDLRPGGAWRFVQRAPDGKEYPFVGVYRAITPPRQLVFTFVFPVDGWSDRPTVVTLDFEDVNGKTRLTQTILHQSVADRDAYLEAGMKEGATSAFDHLAELLRKLS